MTDCACVQLTRLNLAYNSIGEEGIKVLADALIANTKLHFLDIRGNKVRGLDLRSSGFKVQGSTYSWEQNWRQGRCISKST